MNWILLILLTWLGFNNGPKHDLRKQDTKEDFKMKLYQLIRKYKGIICIIVFLISLAVFIWICFSICGISAVESGSYYNNFDKVI